MQAVNRKITRPTMDGKGRKLNGQYTPGQRAELEQRAIADAHTNTRSYAADPDGLLSTQQAAILLCMSLAWLYQSDVPFVKIGSRRRYRRTDLLAYTEQRLCPTKVGKRV
jgi:hypothetical protein